jgi:hypothetical protein
LEAEPTNENGAGLQNQIIQEKADRQKRLRLLERLQYARGLWTRQNYSECLQLLVDLQKEFPDEEEVARLLKTVREDQAEQREHGLLDCRNLRAARRYEEGTARLTNLQEQFPRDEEIRRLWKKSAKTRGTYASCKAWLKQEAPWRRAGTSIKSKIKSLKDYAEMVEIEFQL